jgi:hypothetical protein
MVSKKAIAVAGAVVVGLGVAGYFISQAYAKQQQGGGGAGGGGAGGGGGGGGGGGIIPNVDVVITVRDNCNFNIAFYNYPNDLCNPQNPVAYRLVRTEKGINNEVVYFYKVEVNDKMKPMLVKITTNCKVDAVYPRQSPVCRSGNNYVYNITVNWYPYSFIIYSQPIVLS